MKVVAAPTYNFSSDCCAKVIVIVQFSFLLAAKLFFWGSLV